MKLQMKTLCRRAARLGAGRDIGRHHLARLGLVVPMGLPARSGWPQVSSGGWPLARSWALPPIPITTAHPQPIITVRRPTAPRPMARRIGRELRSGLSSRSARRRLLAQLIQARAPRRSTVRSPQA